MITSHKIGFKEESKDEDLVKMKSDVFIFDDDSKFPTTILNPLFDISLDYFRSTKLNNVAEFLNEAVYVRDDLNLLLV